MLLGPILNRLFGKAYIKNLTDSLERKAYITNQCNLIELQYEITEAIDGTKLVTPDFTLQHGPFFLTYPTSAGYLGNQLTTIKQIETAISNNLPSLILLDDDCMFEHTLSLTEYESIICGLPSDWDIVILGAIEVEDLTNKAVHYTRATVHAQAAGSHGVAIRSTVYNDILMHGKEMVYLGDGLIGRMIDIGKIVYIITPSLCCQKKPFFSDINKRIL